MGISELKALRAIGCSDKEIRKRAEWLPETRARYEQAAADEPRHYARPLDRLNAAILRAAEQLGPEPEWVTRDTPPGTVIGGTPAGPVLLVGWSGDRLVYERSDGALCRSTPVGWYVVKGDR